METSPGYIRLFVATAGAVGSVVFVAVYSRLYTSVVVVREHLQPDQFPAFTQWLVQFRWLALLAPVCILGAGIFALKRSSKAVALEVAVGCQWLFAFLWLLWCFFVWLLPQLPYAE